MVATMRRGCRRWVHTRVCGWNVGWRGHGVFWGMHLDEHMPQMPPRTVAPLTRCCTYRCLHPQVQALIDRHQPQFAAAGCHLSLQRAQNSYWVQVDVNQAMAPGHPVVMPPKPGYEPAPPAAANPASAKPGYEPAKY